MCCPAALSSPGFTGAEVKLLARLDGALPLESTDRLAAEAGIAPARWRALLELTTDLGLLTDRTPPVRGSGLEGTGRVVVDGCGEVASGIADALAQTGTTVMHGRAAVDRAVASPLRPRPDLVVLVGSPVVDPRRGQLWLRHGVPHLPVAPAGPRTLVGPLVDASPGAPCLWCLERHRADRDEAWPAVMSQAAPGRTLALAGPPEGLHDALSPGLAHLVVGTVTLLAMGVLEGHPSPPGVSVEVSLPGPGWTTGAGRPIRSAPSIPLARRRPESPAARRPTAAPWTDRCSAGRDPLAEGCTEGQVNVRRRVHIESSVGADPPPGDGVCHRRGSGARAHLRPAEPPEEVPP